jgi:hypothetical protein
MDKTPEQRRKEERQDEDNLKRNKKLQDDIATAAAGERAARDKARLGGVGLARETYERDAADWRENYFGRALEALSDFYSELTYPDIDGPMREPWKALVLKAKDHIKNQAASMRRLPAPLPAGDVGPSLATGPPSWRSRKLSDGWQRLYQHDDTDLCHDYTAHRRGGVDPGGCGPRSP